MVDTERVRGVQGSRGRLDWEDLKRSETVEVHDEEQTQFDRQLFARRPPPKRDVGLRQQNNQQQFLQQQSQQRGMVEHHGNSNGRVAAAGNKYNDCNGDGGHRTNVLTTTIDLIV